MRYADVYVCKPFILLIKKLTKAAKTSNSGCISLYFAKDGVDATMQHQKKRDKDFVKPKRGNPLIMLLIKKKKAINYDFLYLCTVKRYHL